ncbi:MAG: DUF4870 domain-containing protein [Pseudomonadota bacterium]
MSEITTSAKLTDADKGMILAIWICYVLAVFVGVSAIVGVVIAYVKRGEFSAAGKSHATFAIRTFWITLIVGLISIPLAFIGVGVLTAVAIGVWYLVRTVIGLIKALTQAPIAKPDSYLFG